MFNIFKFFAKKNTVAKKKEPPIVAKKNTTIPTSVKVGTQMRGSGIHLFNTIDRKEFAELIKRQKNGEITIAKIAKLYNVNPATIQSWKKKVSMSKDTELAYNSVMHDVEGVQHN